VGGSRSGWPDRLRPGAVRFTWTSAAFDETVAFYRDLVGLPVVDEFHASFGEDGVIFGVPDTANQLEIVRAQGAATAADPLDLLVFYLDDVEAVTAATSAFRDRGLIPEAQPHPYWAATGGVVYRDPDGRGVVYAPWVYGRDREPSGHEPA
jgi:catechol 2,3-dioxygenase-like lactoylglutathione lyase family enzyme